MDSTAPPPFPRVQSIIATLVGGVLLPTLLTVVRANDRPRPYGDVLRATPGLLLHLSMNDDAAPALRDQLALAGQGTWPTVSSGYPPLGQAIHCQGSPLPIPDLGEHDAVTVECWIRLTRPIDDTLAALYACDGWSQGLVHLNVLRDGTLEFAVNGANGYLRSESGVLTPEQWTHVAATWDRIGGKQCLYRNGTLIASGPLPPALRVRLVSGALAGWRNPQPTRSLTADIDEFAVYDTALTLGQIRSHYQAGRGVTARTVDFALEIRPLLANRCVRCHGPDTQESGLRLDVRDAAVRGGESGEPAIVNYDSRASHLIQRITSQERSSVMPPEGEPLSGAEIELLSAWIDQGADWPDALAGSLPPHHVATDHWSFQSLPEPNRRFQILPVNEAAHPIDRFVHAELSARGLLPSPLADRRTLLRRLHYVMLGLPPTPEDVAEFENDPRPLAWSIQVDRVLASPRYGERWASHWLDVIRYGDTHGFEVNTPRDHAWPYRDYVIASWNDDKPYDRFVAEQIAGDQLSADAATGFLVAAPALLPGQVGKDEASRRLARQDELHEVVVSVGAGLLGLTAGCARCHHHKFDPLSQTDYYQLQAIFAGLHYGDRPLEPTSPWGLSENAQRQSTAVFGGTFTAPAPTHRLYRGDPMQRRERVAPDVPAVFGSLGLSAAATDAERRLALARWLTQPNHPLTARVFVNRIWQHHFGTGLVATPSDFGGMGARPSHPGLLDWLAMDFVEHGWSLKHLHRQILTSETFQQSSTPRLEGMAQDAESRWLWRYPPRRLDMEPIRDSMLAVSGVLDLTMGGPGFLVFRPNTNYVRVYDPKDEWGPGDWRRMIYAHRVRMAQDGVFGAFDCPDAGQPAPRRGRSTTAMQALNLLNSTFVHQQAELFAARLVNEAGGDEAARMRRAFQLTCGRNPTSDEADAVLPVAREHGWTAVCRALLNASEFLFIP
ncbi:MAG: DUF1553 domain-containing protein [Pirellulaceae bacterium]